MLCVYSTLFFLSILVFFLIPVVEREQKKIAFDSTSVVELSKAPIIVGRSETRGRCFESRLGHRC